MFKGGLKAPQDDTLFCEWLSGFWGKAACGFIDVLALHM
jgi:hypothetical protein